MRISKLTLSDVLVAEQGGDTVLPRGGLEGREDRCSREGSASSGGGGGGVSGCSRSLEQLNSIVENIPLDSANIINKGKNIP